MAVVANLPDHVLGRFGVQTDLLMAVLGVLVVLALFLYVRFFFFLVYMLMIAGANIPDQWAAELGLSREALLTTLIVMVAMSLLNYGAKLLPSGLEAKKRKHNPEAIRVLIDAIDRRNLSYVKTLLTMDFDLDDTNDQGVTPLMKAAQRGEFKMVQMLIKRGASPFVVGPNGRASEVALQHNFPAVNEFLRKVEEVQAAEAAKKDEAAPQSVAAAESAG
jgi:ankyrin repeat protein